MARPKKTHELAPKTIKPEKKLEVKRMVRVESGDVFLIQKNIPISGTFRSLGASLRYPFSEMAAGESFEIKVKKDEAKTKVSRLSSACVAFCKSRNNAAKFTVRRTSPETVRVWRIK
jgi:hypothetical protein